MGVFSFIHSFIHLFERQLQREGERSSNRWFTLQEEQWLDLGPLDLEFGIPSEFTTCNHPLLLPQVRK